jgi:hypothetical protein
MPLPVEYPRHQPEQTLLHQVVREHIESFLVRGREKNAPVARFVERELRAYLACGVLATASYGCIAMRVATTAG